MVEQVGQCLSLEVEIKIDDIPISGRVRPTGSQSWLSFVGWMGLSGALTAAVEQTAGRAREPDPTGPDSAG